MSVDGNRSTPSGTPSWSASGISAVGGCEGVIVGTGVRVEVGAIVGGGVGDGIGVGSGNASCAIAMEVPSKMTFAIHECVAPSFHKQP